MIGAILITARLKSTRLKRKVLKPLCGIPMLDYLVKKMRNVHILDRIIIITSDLPDDLDLVNYAYHNNIEFYCGDPDDVLLRMKCAVINYNLDYIISVTADNPWISSTWIDRLISYCLTHQFDYGRITGLPFGTFSYFLRSEAIIKACNIKATNDTEVWGGYFTEKNGFLVGELKVPTDSIYYRPSYRLTVDTQEDFDLAESIASNLKLHCKSYPSLKFIINILDENPGLLQLNKNVTQALSKPIKLKRVNLHEPKN